MGTTQDKLDNRPRGAVAPYSPGGRAPRREHEHGYNLIPTGQLPAQQLGGRGYSVRVDELELERFIYERGESA